MKKRTKKCKLCTNGAQWTIRTDETKTAKNVCGTDLSKLVREHKDAQIAWIG